MKRPEVIIVGAGPAGSSAAIKLAQAGKNVVLIDRAENIGEKNISGAVLWGNDLAELIPDWQSEAPIERAIKNKKIGFLSKDDATIIDMHFEQWKHAPYAGVSVLRVPFDSWLASKAAEAGAKIIPGVMISSLIHENGKVVGVKQGDEELRADVVILAEGANARLMLKEGHFKDSSKTKYELHEMMAGYKEVWRLDQGVLQERFMLDENEGVAGEFILGNIPGAMLSGGFFYTNKNTLSLGTIVHAESLVPGERAYNAVEYFKSHPYIRRLIKDAELIEYGSKLIPEMGIDGFPNFYGDGWMAVGDAAGFVFSNGLLIQGINYAIKSGILAAETILETNGSDKNSLKLYEKKLKNSYILKDFKRFNKVKKVTKDKALFKIFPVAINEGMRDFLTETGKPKEHLSDVLLESFKKHGLGTFKLLMKLKNFRHL